MPLPLAPLAGTALKYGAVALVAYATRQGLRRALRPGRIDQRAEDALDDLDEGLAIHRPKDRDQTSTAARLRRSVRIAGRTYTLDAGLLARFRLTRTD